MNIKSWDMTQFAPVGSSSRVGVTVRGGASGMGGRTFRAQLSGFNEVPPVLTPASGTFEARLTDEDTLEYSLTYADLTTPAAAAHIHFGEPGVNGGVVAFLCGGDDAPSCAGRGGTVNGTITPDDVRGLPAQGVSPGDFGGLLRMMREGAAYVNVHSSRFPEGEIRGQIR